MAAQIQSVVRERILDGTLHGGARLPSSRDLAEDLGVSRSVVVQAYEQLIVGGYLRAAQGSGTRVATHLPRPRRAPVEPNAATGVRFDLRVDATSMELFPSREWLQSYQHVVRSIGGVGPRRHQLGDPALRTELAAYLGRSRGVLATGAEVVVTADFDHTVGVVWHALRELGVDHLAVEDPGAPWHVRGAERAGLWVTGVPVDDEGVDVEALTRTGARAVLVTPSSQLPTGAVLSPARREALLRWAVDVDGWVVEYDRDGLLWLGAGSGPLALQRQHAERVIYAGSTRGLLGPCVRLGWWVAPDAVADRLGRAQSGAPDPLTQLAFAHFVSSGVLDQHVRHVRQVYRERRAVLVDAVAEHLPGAGVVGEPAGTHAYLRLPAGADDVRLAAAARTRSVLVHAGTHFRLDRRPAAPGLPLGYGAVRRGLLAEAVGVLAGALREGGPRTGDRPVPVPQAIG
ncbi:PLP-dependent aminotransferase family protein [Actinosynnema sp. NPDC020468]|uniref:aminotransferase-like domain-containing protein n=1 Tax=Actinosynnema sp. NPDC020468 TaxID=3154488 RepID=UPI0033F30FF1